jgi:hypothetical protein
MSCSVSGARRIGCRSHLEEIAEKLSNEDTAFRAGSLKGQAKLQENFIEETPVIEPSLSRLNR